MLNPPLGDGGFNYIITGSGCAGLSLLYRMLQHPFFNNKQILVIDKSAKTTKTTNDHTWCFWEQQPGLFEEIVHHKWRELDFYSNHFSARFSILPYEYKMIKGIDFYNYVLGKAKQKSNIHFYYGNVQSLYNENDKAIATVDEEKFTADYIFNSILFDKPYANSSSAERNSEDKNNFYYLLQHFKGWLIETSCAIFDERIATFMDFRINQNHGTAFAYLLPIASNRALVEYTLIAEKLLHPHEYDEALKEYVNEFLRLNDYTIKKEEFGVIPMTNYPFSKGEGKIVNIGTAGGQTKASSGFTFRFIQKHSDAIIEKLINNKDPHIGFSFPQKRFNLYDSILLNILCHKKMSAEKIFADPFKKNPPHRFLRFLDNETNFVEELKIMNSVSAKIFLPTAIHELFK